MKMSPTGRSRGARHRASRQRRCRHRRPRRGEAGRNRRRRMEADRECRFHPQPELSSGSGSAASEIRLQRFALHLLPYETRRTGIYSCGPVRRPMDIQQTIEDATGAALKAIQAMENAHIGRAAHPRSGDLSYPIFRRKAARSANAARWNVRSAPSTKTNGVTRCSTNRAAAVAAPAWAPARCA